jgi:hypothetical protein
MSNHLMAYFLLSLLYIFFDSAPHCVTRLHMPRRV